MARADSEANEVTDGPVDGRPALSLDEARRLAADRFGLVGEPRELPSYRDQNVLLRGADGTAHVLKLANADEDPSLLRCQNEVMTRLADADTPFSFPHPVPSVDGETLSSVERNGVRHALRLLTWVDGVPLAEARPHTAELLGRVGTLMGELDRALDGYDHPATHRDLVWDLRGGRRLVEAGLGTIPQPRRRAVVERAIALFDTEAAPRLDELRTAVIHGDGNDWNVLVDPLPKPLAGRDVVGLIDFGDLVHSWLAAEPAITAAYAMLGKRDPLTAACSVVRRYHGVLPLTEQEVEALYALILLRLCMSVVMSAGQASRGEDDPYLSVSEAGAWALLEALDTVHPRLARYRLREACGLPPVPAMARLTRWLVEEAEPGPVLDPDPFAVARLILDLTPGSLEMEGLHGSDDSDAWTRVIFGRMEAAGASLGLGRYDEVRSWYSEDIFRTATDEGDAWRSVHVGVDLFAEPGTPVLAPLDATVEAVRNNAGRLDYGPTVILRHEAGDAGVVFHTLYGHLAPDALELETGAKLREGDRIGAIGAPPGNGDWAAHLHLQLIVDLLDRDGEYPGVSLPAERTLWKALSPDPNLLLRLPELEPAGEAPRPGDLMEARSKVIGPNLSVSYRRPLHIVRGHMQHLYDADGQAYLDCVNNVAHVGHEHPRVVAALREQTAVLNTNTRYLHEGLVRYAERLAALFPDPLSVCYLVNSGSEANELALRLARAHTGRRDVIVLDAAYHGHTTSLIDLSPYKFDGPGGSGAPEGTHVVPLPDPFRGPYRGPDSGPRYAAHVAEAVAAAAERGGVAALFAESLPSCGGQIVLPDNFLGEAYAHVRGAGGVCVADEVQVGFGRVGSHAWGFETQGVVPDIVTLGKPMGNGHPLAAVVTTPAVAASFADGMEYFNTFGGNPVSCAVGMAVLDVLEEDGLQEHARVVGGHFLAGLHGLVERHRLVGDARGLGLFLGIELVLDRDTLEPAGAHAAHLVERMRDHGILLSTDGPDHNVVKIKPPMCFTARDADRVVETLDRVLQEDALRV